MARGFNGSDQTLSYASPVLSATPITLAAWFNLANTSGVKTVLGIGGLYGGVSVQEWVILANGTAFWALTQNETNVQAISGASLSSGTWYHGCGVFAASNSRAAYINGTDKGTDANSKTPDAGSLSRTCIGVRSYNGADQKMNGMIAEAAVWNVALTDDEVAILAKGLSPLAVHPSNLLAYWPLIGNYSPEIDLVGGYGMTLSASAPTKADHPRVLYPSKVLSSMSVGGTPPVGTTARSFAVIAG